MLDLCDTFSYNQCKEINLTCRCFNSLQLAVVHAIVEVMRTVCVLVHKKDLSAIRKQGVTTNRDEGQYNPSHVFNELFTDMSG